MGGDGNAAIFLSQLLYWSKRTTDRDGWFYDTAAELEKQTGLGKRAQATARKNLKALGVLEDKIKGVPPIVHFRLDLDLVARLVTEAQTSLQKKSKETENVIQFPLQRENQFDRIGEDQLPPQGEEQNDRTGGDLIQRLSETTAENTTETTGSEISPPQIGKANSDVPSEQGKGDRTPPPTPSARPPWRDVEDGMHQAASSSKTKTEYFREATALPNDHGWTTQDIKRAQELFLRGVDIADGDAIVIEGGYPADDRGRRPIKKDVNSIFTHVKKADFDRLRMALIHYAAEIREKPEGELKYVFKLTNWIEKDEWERYVDMAPKSAPSRPTKQATTLSTHDHIDSLVRLSGRAKGA